MACSTAAGVVACNVSNDSTATITTLIVQTIETVITRTERTVTTVHNFSGQTFTLSPASPPWPTDSATPATGSPTSLPSVLPPAKTLESTNPASSVLTSSMVSTFTALTVTITELVIVLQDSIGGALTSSTVTLPPTNITPTSQSAAGLLTSTIGHKQGNGWNAWSDAARGGLIAGCVVVFLSLMLLIFCGCLRLHKRTLIQHDSTVNSHPGFISGHPIYGHGPGFPAMRGGTATEQNLKGIRECFGLKARKSSAAKSNNEKAHSYAKRRERRPAFYLPPVPEEEEYE